MPPQLGEAAPDFTLPNQNGEPVQLKKLLEHGPVVLFFYPKDFTAGCTAQACSFRDAYRAFTAVGAQVVGISSDSSKTHQAFAQRHQLPFPLLSDQGGKVRHLYGVEKSLWLIPGRATFVIDRQGVIRHLFSSQIRATRHVTEALDLLKALHK